MTNAAFALSEHDLDVRAVDERSAARYIGYSVYWLRLARRQNKGPSYLQIGRAIRYRVSDLESWLEKHRVRTKDGR